MILNEFVVAEANWWSVEVSAFIPFQEKVDTCVNNLTTILAP